MTAKYNKFSTDEAALTALGKQLFAARLNRDQTQAELAHEAGVSRRSVSKLENGHVVDTRILVRILRGLDLLENLDGLFPEVVSPVALVHARGKNRERASGSRSNKGRKNGGPKPPDEGRWTWPQV